jgi:hypothetical protein
MKEASMDVLIEMEKQGLIQLTRGMNISDIGPKHPGFGAVLGAEFPFEFNGQVYRLIVDKFSWRTSTSGDFVIVVDEKLTAKNSPKRKERLVPRLYKAAKELSSSCRTTGDEYFYNARAKDILDTILHEYERKHKL